MPHTLVVSCLDGFNSLAICEGGPFSKMCLLLLPRRIAMKMVMKLIAGLAVTAILATSADA